MKTLTIILSFLLSLHAFAQSGKHALHTKESRKHAAQHTMTVGPSAEYHAEDTWLYKNQDFKIFDDNENDQTRWYYYHALLKTQLPGPGDWNEFHQGADFSVEQNLPEFRQRPGYYLVHSGNPEQFIRIIHVRINNVNPEISYALRQDKTNPFELRPLLTPADFDGEVRCHFRGSGGVFLRESADNFSRIPFIAWLRPGAALTWETPGRKTIEVFLPNNSTQHIVVDIVTLISTEKEILLAVNANDTDNDNVQDRKQKTLLDPTEDPPQENIHDEDFKRVHIHLTCPHDNPELPPHWQYGFYENSAPVNAILQNLKNRHATVRLSRTKNIQVFSSTIKRPQNTRLLNQHIYDPGVTDLGTYLWNQAGNGYHEITFSPEGDPQKERRFFTQLCLEGIGGSTADPAQHDGDSIRFDFRKDNKVFASYAIPVTVIHLRLNYAPGLGELGLPPGTSFDENTPLNIIHNPSTILIPETGIENPEAIFKLEKMDQPFLAAEKYRNAIQWDISSYPFVTVQFQNGPRQLLDGNAQFIGPNYGKTVVISGTHEGMILISVRLAEAQSSYLSWPVRVVRDKEIPYFFQFFSSNPPIKNDTLLAALDTIPAGIRNANIILRQAGMSLFPAEREIVNPTYRMELHTARPTISIQPPHAILRFDNYPLQLLTSHLFDHYQSRNTAGNEHREQFARFKIINALGEPLPNTGIQHRLNGISDLTFSSDNNNRYTLNFLYSGPPELLIPEDETVLPVHLTFDVPDEGELDFQRITHGDTEAFFYPNLPSWLVQGPAHTLTHEISALTEVFNINVVESLQFSKQPADSAHTVAIPPNPLCSASSSIIQTLPSEENPKAHMRVLQAPMSWLEYTIPGPDGNPVKRSLLDYEFSGTILGFWDTFFPDLTPLWKAQNLGTIISRELCYSRGISIRGPGPLDDSHSPSGYIPAVDTPPERTTPAQADLHNLMKRPFTDPEHHLDISLSQAIISSYGIDYPPPL